MKQNHIVFGILALAVFVPTAFAATPKVTPKTASASGTPIPSSIQTKIDDLKERLATKVAELRKTTPKAIYGKVTNVTVSTLTIDLGGKAVRIELTDDIKVAQVLKGKRTALSIDKVTKGDEVTVFGDYDSTLDLLKAKYIFIENDTLPQRIVGTVQTVDRTNFNFSVKGVDGQTYTVDVETTTKSNVWNKNGTIEKAGFSKVVEGSFVSVLGDTDLKKTNYLSGNRILIINLVEPTPTPTKEVTPTPTKKAAATTPAPTKKTTVTPTP